MTIFLLFYVDAQKLANCFHGRVVSRKLFRVHSEYCTVQANCNMNIFFLIQPASTGHTVSTLPRSCELTKSKFKKQYYKRVRWEIYALYSQVTMGEPRLNARQPPQKKA